MSSPSVVPTTLEEVGDFGGHDLSIELRCVDILHGELGVVDVELIIESSLEAVDDLPTVTDDRTRSFCVEDDLRSLWSSLDVQPAESSSLRVVLEELADELSLDVAVDEIPDVVLRHDPTSELAVVIVELGLTRTEVLDEQLQVDLVVILWRGTASGSGHESSTLLPTVCRTVRDVKILWVDVEVIELMTCILNGASDEFDELT